MAGVTVAVLGATRVYVDGCEVPLSPRQRAVVACLVLRGSGVSPDSLATSAQIATKDSLQTTIADLRRRLRTAGASSVVRLRPGGYELVDADLDLHRAGRTLDEAERLRGSGQLSHARGLYREALDALSVGPPYVELDEVEIAAEHLAWDELRVRAAEGWFETRIRLGEHLAALDDLTRFASARPTHEGLVAWCAVALALAHRQADALRVLADLRAALVAELGQSMGAFATRVELAILRQDLASLGCTFRPSPTGLPTPLRSMLDAHFVGRRLELATLAEVLDRPQATLVVVSGGPGVGKSALASRVAERALEAGRIVTYAWCEHDEISGHAATWRWIADLGLLQDIEADESRVLNAVQLSERLRQHLRLIGPTSLVLDDGQWIDSGSASVLRSLLSATDADLHVLVTVRDTQLGAPWRTLHAALAQRDLTVEIRLSELELHDVVELAERVRSDLPPGPRRRLARRVFELSSGNALIASRLLAAGALSSPVPTALELALMRELESLPLATQVALRTAAVVGRQFDVRLLAALLGESTVDLLERLEPARTAAIVEESDQVDSYRFHHDMYRSVLLAEMPGLRAREVHQRIAALLGGSDLDTRTRRALHLCDAVPSTPIEVARREALEVGHSCLLDGDHSAAAALLDRARALSKDGPDRDAVVVPLVSALEHLGEVERCEELLDEAFRRALMLEDTEQMVALALAGHGRGVPVGRVDGRRARLAVALAHLDPGDERHRLELMAQIAMSEAAAGALTEARGTSGEARRLARRVGGAGVQGRAALARRAAFEGSADSRFRCAASRVAVDRAARSGDVASQAVASAFLTADLLQAGRLSEALASSSVEDELAERSPTPKERWFALARRVCFSQLAGHFETVEAGTAAALDLGNELGFVEAFSGWTLQVFSTALLQTGVGDLAPAIAVVVESSPGVPAWQAGLALAAVDTRDPAASERLSEAVMRLEAAPESPYAVAGWMVAGQACAELGATRLAAPIARHLAPYARQLVVVGTTVASLGPVDRILGLLALTQGERAEACTLFHRAADLSRRVASPPWQLWSDASGLVAEQGLAALTELEGPAVAAGMPALKDHLFRVAEVTR